MLRSTTVSALLIASAACWGVAVQAQSGSPSLNCGSISGSAGGLADAMVCSDPEIGASNGRLVEHVSTVTSMLEEQGEDGAEELQEFEETQTAWLAERNACSRSQDPRACVAEVYANREAELVTTFQLAEPSNEVTYTCPGQAAGGLSISFFDLARPAVRIESGGEVLTGASTTTVDGSKYALSSGQDVWVRKDVARFTDTDGTTVTCLIDDS